MEARSRLAALDLRTDPSASTSNQGKANTPNLLLLNVWLVIHGNIPFSLEATQQNVKF